MSAPPLTLAAQTTLVTSHNERTISFGNERPPPNFSCQHRTPSTHTYDLIAENFVTYAKGGTTLRAKHGRHHRSRRYQADCFAKPRKWDPIPDCRGQDPGDQASKKRVLRRPSFLVRGGPFLEVGLTLTAAYEPWF